MCHPEFQIIDFDASTRLILADMSSDSGSRAWEWARAFQSEGKLVHSIGWTPSSFMKARGNGRLDPWNALYELFKYSQSLVHIPLEEVPLTPDQTLNSAMSEFAKIVDFKRVELIKRLWEGVALSGWLEGRWEPDRSAQPEVRKLIIQTRPSQGVAPQQGHDDRVVRVSARHRSRWPDSFFEELDLSVYPNLVRIEWRTRSGGLLFEQEVLLPVERLSRMGLPVHVLGESTGLPPIELRQIDKLRQVAATVDWLH